MLVKSYECVDCKKHQDHLTYNDHRDFETKCVECQSTNLRQVPSTFGGYTIKGNNGASVRPKSAGYRKGK